MPDRWSRAHVALHWVGALLVLGIAMGGFVMHDLPADSGGRLLLSRMHTGGGLLLVLLTVVRLVVRRRGGAIAPLPLSDLHRRGVGAVHGLMYALMFAIGATGLATAAASAWPDYLRGELAAAPDLESVPPREGHEVFVFALLTLVMLHVGGVLLQEAQKGGILRRMSPFGR
jgi:cytochrome b561